MASMLDMVRGKAESYAAKSDLEDPLLKRKIPEGREKDIVSLPFLMQ